MSKMKLSLVASALAGAVVFAGNASAADPLENLHAAERKIHQEAARSQTKIDSLQEQTQEIVVEYRGVVDETEINKEYNDHVAKLVAAQNAKIASLDKQISVIEDTKRNVVPLMYRMIDMLDQFVQADIPIKLERRQARIENLRDNMVNPDVSTSEKYRKVLEAYQIEKDYGSAVDAWQGKGTFDGVEMTVDFVHVGRVAYIAQSMDLKNAWVWNNESRAWEKLGEEYLKDITKTIRIARKQAPMELIKLPIFAAE